MGEKVKSHQDLVVWQKSILLVKLYFPKMVVKGKQSIESRETYVVEGTPKRGPATKLYFDVQSGVLARAEFRIQDEHGTEKQQIDYADYKEVGGVKTPFCVRMTGQMNLTFRFSEVRNNVTINDDAFQKPRKQ
jgi:outer membrane lipoprotein-sorting protein